MTKSKRNGEENLPGIASYKIWRKCNIKRLELDSYDMEKFPRDVVKKKMIEEE